uniref:WD repeat and HMG-box DNA-binding protein 1-like n=1 Tax=Hirondellea gigas TaxID=1518452 RepID=A0A6A7FYA2_9CRUS
MGGELRPTRYAHSEGHTDVCYSDDGKQLITCGEDGEVRVFQGLDDDDCLTHSVGEKAYAVAYKHPALVVAADSNCVQCFDAEDGAPGQVLTRFTAHPTCIHVSGKLVAAGASDMVVRVQDTLDYRDSVLEGHMAPILSVALDPKGEYVASSSCDGSVKVWFLATQSAVKTLPDVHAKSNRVTASPTLCRIAFTPSGSHLLLPRANKVEVYERSTWNKEREFGHPDSTSALSIVAVSRCGSLVATSSSAGEISVFRYSSGSMVMSVQHPKKLAITGLVWNPDVNARELAFVDCQGQLGTVVQIDAAANSSLESKSSKTTTNDTPEPFPPLNVEASMDDMLAEINRDNNDGLGGDDFAALMGDDDDDDNEVSIAKMKSQMGFADDENGTFIGLPTQHGTGSSSTTPVPPAVAPTVPQPSLQLPELQRCFTPSMTPEHHSQRYMLWNRIGVVKQYNTEEDSSIGVEFHDTSFHHSIHQPNSQPCYTIAALSDNALVLAAESNSDSPSRVSVTLLGTGSSDGGQDWQVDLPAGEDVTAVAASSELVCIASDRRLVRLLSIGGTCTDVLCVPGPLVCMAAHQHLLMILFHVGIGAAGDQQIHLLVLNTKPTANRGGSDIHHPVPIPAPVPLSPRSYVAWAGFTDEGTPVVVDSDGYVRMKHPKYPGNWTVILASKEMTKGRSDHHFVLGVSETEGKVRSILCRGSRFPLVVPPPYITLLDFKISVLDEQSDKGELEGSMLLTGLQVSTLISVQKSGTQDVSAQLQESETMLQTTLIKLFALSCRSGREVRAFNLCQLMDDHTLQSVVKYASKLGNEHLADIIADYIEERRAEQEQQQEERSQHLTGLPSLNNTMTQQTYTPNASYQSLSLSAATPGLVNGGPPSNSAEEQEQEKENADEIEDDDDVVEATPQTDQSNPLLAAAARRNKHNLSLDASMMPSRVNPFKKSTPVADVRKGFQGLDVYRPRVEPSAPILRPVLKKKSKSERGQVKSQLASGASQAKLPSSFSMSKGSKNNNSTASNKINSNESSLPTLTSSDCDSTAATNGTSNGRVLNDISVAVKFRESTMFRSTTAMHLWWADNEGLVRGDEDDTQIKMLVPKAAMLFKDLSDEVKTKYKKLASENASQLLDKENTAVTTEGDMKRKRDDDVATSAATAADVNVKKPKPGCGISKLAAFAFNKE